jgi:hypothetical protein
MVGALLARGMLVGLVAAVLSFGFLKVAGEPALERALAFETHMHAGAGEPELVSRDVQAGLGLFTGVTVFGVALGGLFALVFALAYGRMGPYGPRAASALLAMSGFIALCLVPSLKYPANPPAIGDPATIDARTGLYFAMLAISVAAMAAAWMLRQRLARPCGAWNAAIIAGGAYLVAAVLVSLALPVVDEAPDGFPAVALWQFRLASLGAQAILWATIGLGFGALAERALTANRQARFETA